MTATVGWLSSHLDQALAFPWAEGFGTELTLWWTRLRRLVRTNDEPVRRDASCPVCSLRSLVEADGEVWCRVDQRVRFADDHVVAYAKDPSKHADIWDEASVGGQVQLRHERVMAILDDLGAVVCAPTP